MEDLNPYRSQFPITETCTFLNHAAVSSPSLRVGAAVEALYGEFSRHGISRYPQWMKRVSEIRGLCATLIHADPEEIAFVGNTSEGLSAVAAGLDWKPGDVVMATRPDFPTNIYPWMNLERKGVEVVFVQREQGRFTVDQVQKLLHPRTRLLAVSTVDFATGFRCDLEALGDLCRRKGLLFCVDAIQSLGAVPMDVRKYGIHFMAAGGHKWLLSSMGCALLFIAREANDRIHPERVGWKSVKEEEAFFTINLDLKTDALRFEPGTLNVPGIYALGAALELLLEVDIEVVHESIQRTNDLLLQGLKARNQDIVTPLSPEERAGILSFVPDKDPAALFSSLSEKKIMVSHRDHMIRLSPHFYNNQDDVDRFFEALDHF